MTRVQITAEPTTVILTVPSNDQGRYYGIVAINYSDHERVEIFETESDYASEDRAERAAGNWLQSAAGKRAVEAECRNIDAEHEDGGRKLRQHRARIAKASRKTRPSVAAAAIKPPTDEAKSVAAILKDCEAENKPATTKELGNRMAPPGASEQEQYDVAYIALDQLRKQGWVVKKTRRAPWEMSEKYRTAASV